MREKLKEQEKHVALEDFQRQTNYEYQSDWRSVLKRRPFNKMGAPERDQDFSIASRDYI